ncbi:conserved Plasmodium protein, unknown function [Plasmodium chabaudi chabaudi]|uniref:Uncharacterized protein n=1 Tax=Plasmodium chabaudi chabaudi TaxID=31271 RepID=A0A1D3S158_PLACU|nr:conserved Plasmodium protein, unknown function [Plasmodium chabaudi chabaudi]
MEKMQKANLFKDETEKAIVHFVVYLIGILLILCIYYNYIILKYYFYSLFWAFIVSIPLHHIKEKLSEFIKEQIIKRKNKIKTLSSRNKYYWESAISDSDKKLKKININLSNVKNTTSWSNIFFSKDEDKQQITTLYDDVKYGIKEINKDDNLNDKNTLTTDIKTGLVSQDEDQKKNNNVISRVKNFFYNVINNIRKELDIYHNVFFLIIKPIWNEKKNDNINSFENYESRNGSEIYFLILHRLAFFYILKRIFQKYNEFLFSIAFFIIIFFFIYKIIKKIWLKYFYNIYIRQYDKLANKISLDYTYIYKHYMNSILTILIIIFSIFIFSSISCFFIFNLYRESVFIINSINNYISSNFKSASIIQTFREYYKQRGKNDIESLYELANITKLPFLNNSTISFISSHLKRAIEIYENVYSYNFIKRKGIALQSSCMLLFIERFANIRENNLLNFKKYAIFLNENIKKKIYEQDGTDFDLSNCLINEQKNSNFFYKFKKLIQGLSKIIFFSNDNKISANEIEDQSEDVPLDDENYSGHSIFKTVFESVLFEGNMDVQKKLEREINSSEDKTYIDQSNELNDENKVKEENAENELNNETNKENSEETDTTKSDIDSEEDGNQSGHTNKRDKDENNKSIQNSTKDYESDKDDNSKFKDFASYTNNIFSSLKKIEDIGKLTKYIIFNNSYGLLKIMIFFVLIFLNFFMFTFDAIIQAMIFFTALYYLILSKKSLLNYLKDLLLVVDPSSIFFYNITKSLKAIIICTLKRIYFYTMYIWLIFSFFQFPIIYVPTLMCMILSLIPVISPEILILIIVIHLWIIQKQKIISIILFVVNFFIYLYFTTTIYTEIPYIHAWLVSLSLFLSITTFGSKGVILGPFIASIPLIIHQIAVTQNHAANIRILRSKEMKKQKLKQKLKQKQMRKLKEKPKKKLEKKKKQQSTVNNKINKRGKYNETKKNYKVSTETFKISKNLSQSSRLQIKSNTTTKSRKEKTLDKGLSIDDTLLFGNGNKTNHFMKLNYGEKISNSGIFGHYEKIDEPLLKNDENKKKKKNNNTKRASLWKSKFNNLYKIIEINADTYSKFFQENTEENLCKKITSNSINKKKSIIHKSYEHCSYDNIVNNDDENNKLALYIYKRDKQKKKIKHNKKQNKKETKNNLHLLSKKINKNKIITRTSLQKTKDLVNIYSKFQNNLQHFFSYITNDA